MVSCRKPESYFCGGHLTSWLEGFCLNMRKRFEQMAAECFKDHKKLNGLFIL